MRKDIFAKKANIKPLTDHHGGAGCIHGVVNIGRVQGDVLRDSITVAEPMEIEMVELRPRPTAQSEAVRHHFCNEIKRPA